jgi:arylformamidase
MKIVDISHTLNNNSIFFNSGWHSATIVSEIATIESAGRNTKKIVIGSHNGTHLDAPLHFIKDGFDTNSIDLNVLFGEVQIIDLSNIKSRIVELEDIHDKISCKRVIFCFGWAKHWNTSKFYQDFPYFSSEAIDYLMCCGVLLLGIDTPSPDKITESASLSEDSPNHKSLLSKNVVILEYLNLSNINYDANYVLCALPLKIEGLDGSPVRAVLIEGEIYNVR